MNKIRALTGSGQNFFLAAAAFLALAVVPDRAAWNYAAGALDEQSLRIIFTSTALPAAAAAAFALVCWGLGRAVARRLEPDAGYALSFGLGLGLVAQSVFFLGCAGGLRTGPLLALLAAAAAVAAPQLWSLRADLARQGLPTLPSRGAALLAGVLAAAAWHASVRALAPIVDWDCLAYHIAMGKIYLREGRVFMPPWLVPSHWPHLMEAFYSLPLAFGVDTAASLTHAAACAAAVGAVFALSQPDLGSSWAWLAAAIFAAQPIELILAGTPHSDGALALFHVLSFSVLWRWACRPRADTRTLALAGLLAGLGCATKYHGAVLMAAWTGWLALASPHRPRARWAAVYFLCALAVAAPWYLNAWLRAGDPLWPFLRAVLPDRDGAEIIAASFDKFAAIPLAEVPGNWIEAGAGYLLWPALALAGGALLARRRPPALVAFLFVPLCVYLPVIIRSGVAWRFLWPCYAAPAVAAAWGARELWATGRTTVRALVLAAAGFALFPLAQSGSGNELFVVLGLRSAQQPQADRRERYLDLRLDHYGFYREVNALLAGKKSRVLIFRDIRGYYLDVDYVWGGPGQQGVLDYSTLADAKALGARLDELGVTHVLINAGLGMYWPGRGEYTFRVCGLMDGLLARRGRLVLRRGAFSLFELEARSISPATGVSKRPSI